MAIYIKDATMPTSCYSCPFENGGDCYGGQNKRIMDVDDDEELFLSSRHPKCPLVYIPEPHGRLIDADKLAEMAATSSLLMNGEMIKWICLNT